MTKEVLIKIFQFGYVLPTVIMLAIMVWQVWKYTRKCNHIIYSYEVKRMLWSFVPALNILYVLFFFLSKWEEYMVRHKPFKK